MLTAPTGPAKNGAANVRPNRENVVSASRLGTSVSIFTRICCHLSKLRMAVSPIPLVPGPGMVLRQAAPLHTGHLAGAHMAAGLL